MPQKVTRRQVAGLLRKLESERLGGPLLGRMWRSREEELKRDEWSQLGRTPYGKGRSDYVRRMHFFVNTLPPGRGQKVVELGCADGVTTLVGAKLHPGAFFVGIDKHRRVLDHAKLQLLRTRVRNAYFEKATARRAPLKSGSADQVWMQNVLQVGNIREEAMRIVRPGGVIKIANYYRGPIPNEPLKLFFEAARRHMLSRFPGFDIEVNGFPAGNMIQLFVTARKPK